MTMAIFTIPTLRDGTGHYEQLTTLDGVEYRLVFDYNSRDQTWYLSVYRDNDIPLYGYQSLRCVSNWPISRPGIDPDAPRGFLLVYCGLDDGRDPGLTDLAEGARCRLLYSDAEGVDAIRATL